MLVRAEEPKTQAQRGRDRQGVTQYEGQARDPGRLESLETLPPRQQNAPSVPCLPPPAPQTSSSQESNETFRGRGVSPPPLPEERKDRRREEGGYERVSPSSKTTHGGGWRSFGSEVEPGPAPPLPALRGAGATAPAPPPAADPRRRQVPPGPIARPTESRHQALWIG